MKVFKSLEAPNIWKQAFIPLAIFVHEFDCWCGWTRLYHTLCLGSSVCTLLYYCQSDKTGINTGIWIFGKKVLLPIGCSQVDYDTHRVYAVNLTKAQVEALPEFTDGMTVDFDYEHQVRQVYRPSSSFSVFDSSGVGYAGYGTEPPAPPYVPTSYGVGYEGYENALPTPGKALSPDTDHSAAVDHCDSYTYQQDPSLYYMNDQNHQRLKLYEKRLVANRKQHKESVNSDVI